jgi:hypothetical protein
VFNITRKQIGELSLQVRKTELVEVGISTRGGKRKFAAPAYVLSEIEKSGHAQD